LSENTKSIIAINTQLHIPKQFYKTLKIMSNMNKLTCTHDEVQKHLEEIMAPQQAKETFDSYCSVMNISVLDIESLAEESFSSVSTLFAKTNGYKLKENLDFVTKKFNLSEEDVLKELFGNCQSNE
jgi:hypothetical protein